MHRRSPNTHLFAPFIIAFAWLSAFGAHNAHAESPDTTQDTTYDIADAGDFADSASKACGSISHEGCCAQNHVFFCKNNEVKSIDCSNLEGVFTWCGWRSDDAIYDCGTNGIAAPENDPPILCENQNCEANCVGRQCGPDGCGGSCGPCAPGQLCSINDGVCQAAHSCGEIGAAGCCEGDTLRFCGGSSASPKLQEKDCSALELNCGWSEDGAWYDCGLESREDPGGAFPRACPPLQPPCVPNCFEKTCGDDGCWGSCGQCAADEVCGEDQRCAPLHTPDVLDTQRSRAPDEGSTNHPAPDIARALDMGDSADPPPPPIKVVKSSCSATDTPSHPLTLLIALTCLALTLRVRRARHEF